MDESNEHKKEHESHESREHDHHEPRHEEHKHEESKREEQKHVAHKPKKHADDKPKKPFFKSVYEDKYKVLLIIPMLVLFLAIVQISYQAASTGDIVHRGVDLKGGISVSIDKGTDPAGLEAFLEQELPGADVSVRKQGKGVLVEASDVLQVDLVDAIKIKMPDIAEGVDYNIGEQKATLGASFFREVVVAIIIAFILMGIVVFITFRVPVPSLAVILAALSDIVVTLAIFNLTGMKLGKGGIAAFLMLIGYSVDTDILLSTRVLKRKQGTVMSRIYSSMKTGLMMNFTTMAAIVVAMSLAHSEVIRQIMIILLIGLFVDIMNTWIQNVGILRLYLERKKRKFKNESEG